jgi:hypothetical protein
MPALTEGERQALLNALIELDGRSLALRRPHADLFGEYRPSDWRIFSANMRSSPSRGPPAAYGTIIRTDRFG